jgi:hypothetical protein
MPATTEAPPSVWRCIGRGTGRRCAAIASGITRVQVLVLWGAATVMLLAAMYPATAIVYWNGSGGWTPTAARAELQRKYGDQHSWVNRIGERKLKVTLQQFSDEFSDGTVYFKEEPDYRRMKAEIAITAVIGCGLAFALKRRRA